MVTCANGVTRPPVGLFQQWKTKPHEMCFNDLEIAITANDIYRHQLNSATHRGHTKPIGAVYGTTCSMGEVQVHMINAKSIRKSFLCVCHHTVAATAAAAGRPPVRHWTLLCSQSAHARVYHITVIDGAAQRQAGWLEESIWRKQRVYDVLPYLCHHLHSFMFWIIHLILDSSSI